MTKNFNLELPGGLLELEFKGWQNGNWQISLATKDKLKKTLLKRSLTPEQAMLLAGKAFNLERNLTNSFKTAIISLKNLIKKL